MAAFKFVQVTDTHLVPAGRRIYGLDPLARLDACVADINAHHGDAAFCVVTGDLVDRGESRAYEALRRALDRLVLPRHLLIGNHDDRRRFRAAFPETPCDGHGFVQSAVRTPVGDFLFLDTHEPGTRAGRYCARRREWLADRLAEASGRPVFLFMHHPPFAIGLPSLDNIALEDPGPFAETLARHDDVRHLFLGHLHRPVSGSWRGIPFSALRGTGHQVRFDWTTVDPVPKSLEPPAYAVVLIEDGLTIVHFHDYLDRSTPIAVNEGDERP